MTHKTALKTISDNKSINHRAHIIATILLSLSILCTCICLCACGNSLANSEYVGTWTARSAEQDGLEMRASDLFGQTSIELKGSGKCTFAIDNETSNGTWEENEDGTGFTIIIDDTQMKFLDTAGIITTEYENALVTFQRAEQR